MVKNYLLSLLVFSLAIAFSYGQATLPLGRTTWNAGNPTGWSNSGASSYTSSFACSTINGGRLDDSGEYYQVFFNSAPDQLSYDIKLTGSSTSSLLVEESTNGTAWSTVNNHITIAVTCTSFSFTLNNASRYVRWTYTKISGNLTIDDVTITASTCTDAVDFANIQSPTTTQTITSGGNFDVFARTYEPGVTPPAGANANINAWIGYSTTNTNPNTWTDWVPATWNVQVGNDDEYQANIGTVITTSGTYYYASRFELNGCDYVYGGSGGLWNNDNVQLNVLADQVDFCSLQSPATGTQVIGGQYNVYARAFEPGITPPAGASANIAAWIGFSRTDATGLADFTSPDWTWVPATYQGQFGNDDEYITDIGPALAIEGVGTYYYVSRFQLNGSDYSYGGITPPNGGGFWDGSTYVSGIMTITNAPCSDLIISEYIEGSGNNKYIEIFNGTGAAVNLSTYDIDIYNNGNVSANSTMPLSGILADGATIVYQDPSASLYGGTTTNLIGGYNGNDAIALVNNGTIIDVIGQIGFNPGTEWTGGSSSTLNRTLRRKSTVQVGDADGSNVFAPNVEWDTYPIDSVDDLGFHFSSCHPDREIQLTINSANVACGFTYNYGTQLIDTNNDVILTIQNLGDLPLQITGLNFATGVQYTLVGAPALPFTIPAISSQNITIRFNPDALGVFLDTLTVVSNDASEGSCNLNLTGISSSNCATTTTVFAAQDFESAPSDTWNYIADHAPIAGNWDVTSNLSNIASAQSGTDFWGITDLERSGHTNQTHELSFSQSLVGFTNVQLAFHYYTIGIDASDSFEYELLFDSVSQGVNDISANTGAWTEVLVNIPDTVNVLDIIFYVDIDATNDQAGLDDFSLSSTTINTVTWDGTNWDWSDGTTPQNTLPNLSTAVVLNAPLSTAAAGLQQSFSACSLTINNVLLTINDGHSVEVDNSLIVNGVNGAINVEPQGSFVQIDDSGTVTATTPTNLTVSKLTSPANNWYEYTYWSSPVFEEIPANGLAASHSNRRFQYNAQYYRDSTYESNNDNTITNGAGIDDVDDNDDDWGIISTSFLIPGVGYAATHDPTVFASTLGCPGICGIRYTFSGLFNNGVITVPLYRNDTETGDNNWNLVGNPYPSAISADTFLATNTGFIDENILEPNPISGGAIYLWSQNTPPSGTTNGNEGFNFSQSDYAIINGTGQTAAQSNGGDSTVPTRYIPSGQGFFISMDNSAPSTQVLPSPVTGENIQTANLIFNNAMRVTGNNNQFFRSEPSTSADNKLWINLSSDNGVFSQVLIGYLDQATDDYDGMYFDAPRNASTAANSIIYSIIPDVEKVFAIQGKNSNSLNLEEIIPIGFYTVIEEPTIYNFSIEQLEGEFMTGNTIYIKDNILNTIHNLSSSDYSFTSEAGKFDERFEIVFTTTSLSINDNQIDTNDITIVELANGDVEFKVSSKHIITNVEILDVLGRRIYNLKGNSSREVYNLSNLKQAGYIAKITLSNGQVISKKTIKQH